MKLEVRSVRITTFGMSLGVAGMILGFAAGAATAFLYPASQAPGAGSLVGFVLAGTAGGAFLGFVLGAAAAWAYNVFAPLTGGVEVELKETDKDE